MRGGNEDLWRNRKPRQQERTIERDTKEEDNSTDKDCVSIVGNKETSVSLFFF